MIWVRVNECLGRLTAVVEEIHDGDCLQEAHSTTARASTLRRSLYPYDSVETIISAPMPRADGERDRNKGDQRMVEMVSTLPPSTRLGIGFLALVTSSLFTTVARPFPRVLFFC